MIDPGILEVKGEMILLDNGFVGNFCLPSSELFL